MRLWNLKDWWLSFIYCLAANKLIKLSNQEVFWFYLAFCLKSLFVEMYNHHLGLKLSVNAIDCQFGILQVLIFFGLIQIKQSCIFAAFVYL